MLEHVLLFEFIHVRTTYSCPVINTYIVTRCHSLLFKVALLCNVDDVLLYKLTSTVCVTSKQLQFQTNYVAINGLYNKNDHKQWSIQFSSSTWLDVILTGLLFVPRHIEFFIDPLKHDCTYAFGWSKYVSAFDVFDCICMCCMFSLGRRS